MDKEVKTDAADMGLRDIAPGYTRFSIKADDTSENNQVHEAFKEFCKVETDNNYTQGLRKLLEYYQGDFKYEVMHEAITEIRVALEDLKSSVVEISKVKEEEDGDSF